MLSQQHIGVKQKKARSRPIPLLITTALYGIIRASFVYLVLDNNPSNPLNDNSDPVTMQYNVGNTTVGLVCYSYDMLKTWLQLLMTSSLWCKRVTVRKVVKTKTNQNSYGSVATKDVDCLSLPRRNEITNFLANNTNYHIDEATILDVVEQIRCMFIDLGPPHLRLLLPYDISPQHIPLETEVTKPSNVVKQERLLDLHYGKAALDEAQSIMWEKFYSSETSRLKYLMSQIKGTRITDSSIRSLSNSDKEAYNNYAVSSFIANVVPTIAATNINNNNLNKINNNSAVNPALIALQHLAVTSKPPKSEGAISSNKRYVDMIDRYFRHTRYKLDIKHEKAAKSLPYRLCDVEWMENLSTQYPFIRFVHNTDENRPAVVPSTVQGYYSQQVQPQQQMQPIPSAQSGTYVSNPPQVYNTKSNTSVNTINYPQQSAVAQPKPAGNIPNFIKPQPSLPQVSSLGYSSQQKTQTQQQPIPQQLVPQQSTFQQSISQQPVPQQLHQQFMPQQLTSQQVHQQPVPQQLHQQPQQEHDNLIEDELVVDDAEVDEDIPNDTDATGDSSDEDQ